MNPTERASTLVEMISASWMSQAICAAAELNIANRLADGPMDIAEISSCTQCHPGALHRLLRALASLDLCIERDDGTFESTDMGALPRTDATDSLDAWALWWGRYRWPMPGELVECIRTGRGARQRAGDAGGRAYRDDDVVAGAVFDRSMVDLTRLAAAAVLRVHDFSAAARVVDVGGGHGEMLVALLTAHPQMQGTLLDLPGAIVGAAEHLARAGVADRCDLVAGSFLDSVPGGGDVYLLKSVLHSWDDERSRIILRNCPCAMPSDASLVLVERVMPARMRGGAGERSAVRSDLHMPLGSGGRERTQDEIGALLADSGFTAIGFVPTGLEHWVIQAVAAPHHR